MIKFYYLKTLYLPTLALVSLLFIGCVNTAVLLKDYDDKKLYGKNITVIKLFNKPTISNPEDIVDNLGAGVPEDVYNSFFNQHAADELKKSNSFGKVVYVNQFSNSNLEPKVLKINRNTKMKILLPKENTTLENDSVKSDFILFLDNLQVSRISVQSGTFIDKACAGGSIGKLMHQINFAIWDNVNGKLVSYGKVIDKSDLLVEVNRSYWEYSIHCIISKILDYSPFPARLGNNGN